MIQLTNSSALRLASGSLCIVIFSCLTLISVSCLHLGQHSGKFFSSVSYRIFSRVLFLQTEHSINSFRISVDYSFFINMPITIPINIP